VAPSERTFAGMATMAVGVGLLTLMDGTGKVLLRELPLVEVVWGRYACNLLALWLLLRLRGRSLVPSRRLPLQLARGVAMVLATAAMFASLSLLPMAETYAVGFTSPLLVALLAGPVLGERVDRWRWAAAVGGFVGVLVVLRPGSGVFGAAAVAPLAMAFCFALYQLATRVLGRFDPPETTMFHSAWIGTVVVLPLLPAVWQMPDPRQLALMLLMGVLGLASHLCMIRAFALAPASLVSPLIYTQMVWAVGFGWLVFGDLPDLWTVTGSLVVAAAGLLLLRSAPENRR
jgi:drug/metabolite transporter (DMT)-like permease